MNEQSPSVLPHRTQSTIHLRVAGWLKDRERLSVRPGADCRRIAIHGDARRTIGGDRSADIWVAGLADNALAVVSNRWPGPTIESLGSATVRLNGRPLEGREALVPGDYVEIAGLLLFVHEQRPLDATHDVAQWIAALKSPIRDERWTAAQMLGALAPDDDDVREALRRARGDREGRVARWIDWALSLGAPAPFYLCVDEKLVGEYPAMRRIEVPHGKRRTIGRANVGRAEVLLPRINVSALHAAVENEDGGWFLEDLGSRNGTSVNSVAISRRVRIYPGDKIRIGSVGLRVRAC